MQALVLAGGHATRLWPITKHRAKPLLPLGKRTILEHLLDQLAPIADDIIVSTNALFADQFDPVLAGRKGTRLIVEEQASEDDKPGALGAILQLADGLDVDEPLLVVAGDNHYGFDVTRFVSEVKDRDGPTVAVKALPERSMARQFGVVELADGTTRIAAFHEKPDDPPSNLAATALYHYPVGWRELFDTYGAVARASESPRKMLDAPGRILEWAVAHERPVHAWPFEEPWYDIGTADGYFDALAGVLGPRHVDGKLDGCEEGPGVYVFGGARAERSRLARTVLMDGATVVDGDLEGCIVDVHARVTGLTLRNALVGPHDELNGPG